jgi:peptidoglycan/xylan/chitin deacetylase (PgdA/CDA1 family)
MNFQGTEKQNVCIPLQQTNIARIALTITLMLTLGVSGLLTITFAGWVKNTQGLRVSVDSNRSTIQPGAQPSPTPLLLSSPSPGDPYVQTGPLPPDLSQAIANLRSQNRLLYNGNPFLPEIALTFDDGPNPYYTPQILNILQKYHVKATFFCIGRLVAAYPALVRQEYAAGHTIGNHSWSHPNLVLLSPASSQLQISKTSDAIEAAIGARPTFFRPPYGRMSVQELTQVYHDGLTTILWNDEGQDWARPGVNVIIQRILRLARNGTIIIMHDGGGDRSQTVAALPFIINGLRQRGFRFMTMQQLLMDLQQHTNVPTNPNLVQPTLI